MDTMRNGIIQQISLEQGWSASTKELMLVDRFGLVQINGLQCTTSGTGWTKFGSLPSAYAASVSRKWGYLACDASMTSGRTTIAECRIDTDGNLEIYAPQAGEKYWGGFAYIAKKLVL